MTLRSTASCASMYCFRRPPSSTECERSVSDWNRTPPFCTARTRMPGILAKDAVDASFFVMRMWCPWAGDSSALTRLSGPFTRDLRCWNSASIFCSTRTHEACSRVSVGVKLALMSHGEDVLLLASRSTASSTSACNFFVSSKHCSKVAVYVFRNDWARASGSSPEPAVSSQATRTSWRMRWHLCSAPYTPMRSANLDCFVAKRTASRSKSGMRRRHARPRSTSRSAGKAQRRSTTCCRFRMACASTAGWRSQDWSFRAPGADTVSFMRP
mmetsp:Transcript_14896/g.44121  ORF Transcript_14896/g.44121 Transcript_14896/m.44121 type:complete len:270 (+) Transcript_14896:996-1805(+)